MRRLGPDRHPQLHPQVAWPSGYVPDTCSSICPAHFSNEQHFGPMAASRIIAEQHFRRIKLPFVIITQAKAGKEKHAPRLRLLACACSLLILVLLFRMLVEGCHSRWLLLRIVRIFSMDIAPSSAPCVLAWPSMRDKPRGLDGSSQYSWRYESRPSRVGATQSIAVYHGELQHSVERYWCVEHIAEHA